MPIQSIKFRPGIDSQKPLLLNEGGWSTCNLMRVKDGCMQTIGGWQRWQTQQLDSPGRTIKSWGDLNGVVRTAIGSDTSVYVVDNGNLINITPLTRTTNPTPNFSTTSGSNVITVIDADLSPISGVSINLNTAISVGGIVIQGNYEIASVTGADSYTIEAAGNATSSVSGGGAVPLFTTTSGSFAITVTLDNHALTVGETFGIPISTTLGGITLFGSYLVQSVVDANNFTIDASATATSNASVSLNGGNAQIIYFGVSAPGGNDYSYGVGPYGMGGYGQGSLYVPGALPYVPLWTLDNWGETLIIGQGNGGIYTYTPGSGETQAQLIFEAPPVNAGMFVAMPQLMVVAWGSSVDGVQQPLLVQWSSAGDYTDWTPTVENQAGDYTIPSGSRIIGAIQGPQQAFIFTDLDMYAMNYLGANETELVWGFIKIADHCGLIAARAVCVVNDLVFWLSGPATNAAPTSYPSGGQFMMYDGSAPRPIPCTVWDKVFQDLDWANAYKIVAAPNALFNTVRWCYPSLSGGTGENDSYVDFNYVEPSWTFGKLPICGWQDYSPVGNPIAGHSDNYLYQHEIGTSANGQPMNWQLGSGAVMIAEGNEMMFVDWLLPEFQWGMTNAPSTDQPVTITINAYRFANDNAPMASNSFGFSANGAGEANPRLRGRHLTFEFSGQGFARLGNVRYRAAPDGRYG